MQQRNDKHNVYMSPIAAHILQQIITRVQVRASLDRTEFRGMHQIDRGALQSTGIHSSAAIAAIIKNISEENTLETEAVMATFANDLKMRTVRTASVDLRSSESNKQNERNEEEENDENDREEEERQQAAEAERQVTDSVSAANTPATTDVIQSVVQPVVEEVSGEATAAAVSHVENILDPSQQLSDLVLHFSESPTAAAVIKVDQMLSQSSSNGQVQSEVKTEREEDKQTDRQDHTSTSSAPTEGSGGSTSITATEGVSESGSRQQGSSRHNSVSRKNRERTASGMSTGSTATTASSSTTNTASTTAATAAPRFLNFKEGMPEFAAQKAVQNIIFDDSTSEGNTRKVFIDKFSAGAASGSPSSGSSAGNKDKLLEVRLFIDGMHEYLLTHRGISLALLYEQEKQRAIINNNNNSNSGDPSTSSLKDGSDSKQLQAQRQLTKRKSLQFLKEHMDLSVVEDSLLVFISFIIFIVVEEALFLPLRNQIIGYLPGGGRMVRN